MSTPSEIRDLHYCVTVVAPDVTPEQMEMANKSFQILLEAKLGGPSPVVPCFRAWTKMKNDGGENLLPGEDEKSAAWVLAYDAANKAGFALLGMELGDPFLIRIISG